jgi:hypothetical protein
MATAKLSARRRGIWLAHDRGGGRPGGGRSAFDRGEERMGIPIVGSAENRSNARASVRPVRFWCRCWCRQRTNYGSRCSCCPSCTPSVSPFQ